MRTNRDKAVAYWLGVAVGVMTVLFAHGAARAADDKATEEVKRLRAELDKAKEEADALRKQNEALTVVLEKALKAASAAENAEKLARARAEETLKKLEETLSKLQELKKDGPPAKPAPLAQGVRGEVTDVDVDRVTLSIGIDAGLAVGTTLDLYRIDDEARYLGTVKIVSAKHLFPKHAIATFTPARKVALDKLKPEELPKTGDQVRQLSDPKQIP
jgi:hypothetical protein